MQSKRSFFNPTLFRKNLSRTWPLWGGVSLVGSLAPLYLLLALASQEIGRTASPQDVATALYQAVTLLVPGRLLRLRGPVRHAGMELSLLRPGGGDDARSAHRTGRGCLSPTPCPGWPWL